MSTISYLASLVNQVIGRQNAIESNAKKVDELPHQNTLEPTSKLPVSRAGVSEHITVQQIISSIQNSNYNQLLAVGNITVIATDIIVESGVSGQINSVIYGISTDTTIPITLCATGFNRKDILVLTTSNTVITISGEETDGAIVLAPPVPIDTVYITEFDVSDSAIGTPIDPILGTQFKKKTESLGFGDPSLSGTNAVIQLRPEGNSYYALGNVGLISIDGFGLDLITGNPDAEAPYSMKDLFIENTGTTPFTLKHDGAGTADVKFFFTDETDLIIPAGGKLWLKYGNPYCQLFFKSWNIAPYKVYTALLTQSGTSRPLATELENTLGVVEYSYDGVSSYSILSNGLFTVGKTVVFFGNIMNNGNGINLISTVQGRDMEPNRIPFYTYLDGAPANSALLTTPIEIRVYN